MILTTQDWWFVKGVFKYLLAVIKETNRSPANGYSNSRSTFDSSSLRHIALILHQF